MFKKTLGRPVVYVYILEKVLNLFLMTVSTSGIDSD